MLVHTSGSTEEQGRPPAQGRSFMLEKRFRTNSSVDPSKPSPRSHYEDELCEVPTFMTKPAQAELKQEPSADSWDSVRSHLALGPRPNSFSGEPASEPFEEDGKTQQAKSGVIVDNSTVDWIDRLTYSNTKANPPEPSVTVIAIGGNTLEQEGSPWKLTRLWITSARTTETLDSLMQMGRWFWLLARISPSHPAVDHA